MSRVVVDTNTLVSGFGWRGAPAAVVDAVLATQLELVTSPPLLDELARVLRYPKLAGVFPDPDRIVTLVATVADLVHPAVRIDVLADDPDNRVLEAAVTGEVDAVVTGDRRFRELDTFQGIDMLTAAETLVRLKDVGEEAR